MERPEGKPNTGVVMTKRFKVEALPAVVESLGEGWRLDLLRSCSSATLEDPFHGKVEAESNFTELQSRKMMKKCRQQLNIIHGRS